ncbi:MAG: DUF4394 domain-containing protein [Rhodobacterales bacterium]|nr:DUF4394 domain-containing protein [Rhodobacterales bacterium]MDX5413863.1 DUF4394 domain-containing protein [Rhodobacterales bacterium]
MTRFFMALAASTALAAPVAAQTAIGLVGDSTIVTIDLSQGSVSNSVTLEGPALLGIDYRAATGRIIGVTEDQAVITIDPATGAVTELSQMETMLPVGDMPVVVDVNPVPDRLRFMTGTTNHRVNMDTGEVTVDGDLHFDATDANAGTAPMIVAVGYINSFGKPEATAMYDIDAGLNALIRQTAPNDGTLATIGDLGVTPNGPLSFDVAGSAEGTNTAWLGTGDALHIVDLETGAIVESRTISGLDGMIRDLTILP